MSGNDRFVVAPERVVPDEYPGFETGIPKTAFSYRHERCRGGCIRADSGIDWLDHRRLHGEIGLIPPSEAEQFQYHSHDPAGTTAGHREPPPNPGPSILLCDRTEARSANAHLAVLPGSNRPCEVCIYSAYFDLVSARVRRCGDRAISGP